MTDDVSPYLKRPRRSLEEVIASITAVRSEAPVAPEPAGPPDPESSATGDGSRKQGR